MSLRKIKIIIKIIAEILKLISDNIPVDKAIASAASKFNMSESEVRDIWIKYK